MKFDRGWLMSNLRETKREDLRARLIAAAKARMEASGLTGLRARDITSDAGCALGALYTVFPDLDALVLQVNSQTLHELDAVMTAAVAGISDSGKAMKVLAAVYLDFARVNPFLWKALFQFQYPSDKQLPGWYADDQAKLLAQIVKPLAKLQPEFDEAALIVRARTLFAAVHGIISISLEERFVGVPIGTLDQEVEQFIDQLILGLEKRRERAGAK
jgi:AcrR family transcriptional regulator